MGIPLSTRGSKPKVRGNRRDGEFFFVFLFLLSRNINSTGSEANHCPRQNKKFAAKLPARKFRGYKCVGPAAALALDEKDKDSEYGSHPRVSHEEVIFRDPKVAAEATVHVA